MNNFKDNFNIFNYDLEFIILKDRVLDAIDFEKWLTLDEISQILHIKGFNLHNNEILKLLNFLIIESGSIIRRDFSNEETKYFKVNDYVKKSNYTKFYFNLNLDGLKKTIVISDTHIGNPNLEDYLLINSIYDFAIKKGISTIFHLGDLFGATKNSKVQELERELNLFLTRYPNPNEVKTYALVGNHDKYINDYLESGAFFQTSDLRALTYFNPNFYMFPYNNSYNPYNTGSLTSYLDNLQVHFSHFLYISYMFSYYPINGIKDLIKYPANLFIDLNNDILLSGHIHQAFFYNIYHQDFKHNTFYLGVPALNKSNLNKTIGYILNFNRDTNNKVISIDIEVLQVDNNYHISIKEVIHHDLNKESKTLKRML